MTVPFTPRKFGEISLDDPFFDSLKADYGEFGEWFKKKKDESAFIMEHHGQIQAFLYLKFEDGPLLDVTPPLPPARRLKIGTMKINPHGTRLGERFVKKAIDYAINGRVDEIYVTVFDKQTALINLFKRYGFVQQAVKDTRNGSELVFVKNMYALTGDILLDYPILNIRDHSVYLLAIYPEYHTRLFPDSKLVNEPFDIVQDVSHTNSIHKVYICSMNVSPLRSGDVLLIYRTKDDAGPAWFRAVVTSACVVEEVRTKASFASFNAFHTYCKNYSVFSEDELLAQWSKRNVYVIRMTYNLAMNKRLTRGRLIEDFGLDRNAYPGFMPLAKDQFVNIVKAGGVNEGLIIN